jgi:hypothetical protein
MPSSKITSVFFAFLVLVMAIPAHAAWNSGMSQADTEQLINDYAATLVELKNSLVPSTVVRDRQNVDAAIARLEEAERLIPQIKADLDAITIEYGTGIAAYNLNAALGMIEELAGRRQQLAEAFVQSAQTEFNGLKHRHESYILGGDSTGPQDVRRALQLVPDHPDAIVLQAAFEDALSKAMATGRAKIAEQVWPATHAQLSEGDAEGLAASALEWLRNSDQWGARQKNPEKILAVTIRNDWVVARKNILGQPIQWGLPVHAAVQNEKDAENGYARHFTLTMVTAEMAGVAKASPWIGAWVGDSHYVLAEKVTAPGAVTETSATSAAGSTSPASTERGAGGAGTPASAGGAARPDAPSGGGSMLGSILWLALVGVNILVGLIASMPLISARLGALAPLMSFAPVIGAISLIVGVAGILLATISLSPLRGIVPQLTAIVVGLFLGKDVLASWFKPAFDKLSAETQQGNIKSMFDKVSALVWNPMLMGPIALGVGIAHLVLGGSLYLI